MKAIRVHQAGEPEEMRLEAIPDPEPGYNQVVIRVHAIGVNPVDTYIRSGRFSYALNFPYTPGMDAAGVVEALGKGVSKVGLGDRVYTAGTVSGAYAEKALCEESQLFPLPSAISYQQGAAIGVPYATAYRAIYHKAMAKAGEWILIHGASGGVGIAAVQLSRGLGLRVIGTAGTERGMELLMSQGCRHVLNHRAPNYLAEVPNSTAGHGVDVILEHLANVNLAHDLKALAPRGRIVIIGSRGVVEIDPREAMMRDATILGMTIMNASETEKESIHAAIVAGLENRSLCPVVGKEMALADAPQAHRDVIASSAYGKIVLVP